MAFWFLCSEMGKILGLTPYGIDAIGKTKILRERTKLVMRRQRVCLEVELAIADNSDVIAPLPSSVLDDEHFFDRRRD